LIEQINEILTAPRLAELYRETELLSRLVDEMKAEVRNG
jgi:hypothetical protein